MIHFFGNTNSTVFAVQTTKELSNEAVEKLTWLFGNQPKINAASLDAFFIGPRAAMISPWSTNAVEITQNMTIEGIIRIEEYKSTTENNTDFDPMLSQKFSVLNQDIFVVDAKPEAVLDIEDIAAYNKQEG